MLQFMVLPLINLTIMTSYPHYVVHNVPAYTVQGSNINTLTILQPAVGTNRLQPTMGVQSAIGVGVLQPAGSLQ